MWLYAFTSYVHMKMKRQKAFNNNTAARLQITCIYRFLKRVKAKLRKLAAIRHPLAWYSSSPDSIAGWRGDVDCHHSLQLPDFHCQLQRHTGCLLCRPTHQPSADHPPGDPRDHFLEFGHSCPPLERWLGFRVTGHKLWRLLSALTNISEHGTVINTQDKLQVQR